MVRLLVAALALLAAFMLYQRLGGNTEEPGLIPQEQQRAMDKAEQLDEEMRRMQEERDKQLQEQTR